jgi:hypothetical protein
MPKALRTGMWKRVKDAVGVQRSVKDLFRLDVRQG